MACIISDRKSTVIYHFSICTVLGFFFLPYKSFKDFILITNFHQFDFGITWWESLCVILLEVHWVYWICKCMIFIKFGNFWAFVYSSILFKYFNSSISPLFLGFHWVKFETVLYYPLGNWGSLHFVCLFVFSHFTLWASLWIIHNIYCYVIKFADLFFLQCLLLQYHSMNLSFMTLYFSAIQFSLRSFFHFSLIMFIFSFKTYLSFKVSVF